MRFFRTRLHAYVALVFLACLVIAGIVILLLPRERVTRANYDKIEVGMSLADVESLLGPPGFQIPLHHPSRVPALGCLQAAGAKVSEVFVKPDDSETIRGIGSTLATAYGWMSPEITILVSSDADGRIVGRGRLDGQRRASVFEIAWSWISDHF